MMSIVMKGAEKFQKKIDDTQKEVSKQTWLALVDGALAIHQTAVDSIKTVKGTRTVKKPNGKIHTLSDPGDPPNTDTGALIKSIAVKYYKSEGRIEVGSFGVGYAMELEFGSYARNLQARPWLRPAFLLNKKNLDEALRLAAKGEYR
jgi:hypothetical protein